MRFLAENEEILCNTLLRKSARAVFSIEIILTLEFFDRISEPRILNAVALLFLVKILQLQGRYGIIQKGEKIGSRYQFRQKEIEAIERARRKNQNKRAEQRLKALELRAKGACAKEVSQATGFCAGYVSQLVKKYREHGLEAISGNHYGGNHRNMSEMEKCV